ncbi:MAG: hypothetical protein GY822_01100 [Deltaproteobacteria bacterium]|nr:hypothetical protein [Deltaproteobacteria bacterium]
MTTTNRKSKSQNQNGNPSCEDTQVFPLVALIKGQISQGLEGLVVFGASQNSGASDVGSALRKLLETQKIPLPLLVEKNETADLTTLSYKDSSTITHAVLVIAKEKDSRSDVKMAVRAIDALGWNLLGWVYYTNDSAFKWKPISTLRRIFEPRSGKSAP